MKDNMTIHQKAFPPTRDQARRENYSQSLSSEISTRLTKAWFSMSALTLVWHSLIFHFLASTHFTASPHLESPPPILPLFPGDWFSLDKQLPKGLATSVLWCLWSFLFYSNRRLAKKTPSKEMWDKHSYSLCSTTHSARDLARQSENILTVLFPTSNSLGWIHAHLALEIKCIYIYNKIKKIKKKPWNLLLTCILRIWYSLSRQLISCCFWPSLSLQSLMSSLSPTTWARRSSTSCTRSLSWDS